MIGNSSGMAEFKNKVSVIIPAFNVEKYIAQAIESALKQAETGEIIVIDDGSDDATYDIVRQMCTHNEKLVLYKHSDDKNHGAGASRNLGIKYAKYDYVSFLDGDDYYLNGRFEQSLPILLNDDKIDGVYEATEVVFENNDLEQEWLSRHGSKLITMHRKTPPEDLLKYLTFGGNGHFQSNSILIRRSIFKKVGYFNEKLRIGQDTELWLRMAASCQLLAGNISEAVTCYRIHDNNRARKKTGKEYSKIRLDIFASLVDWMKGETLPLSKQTIIFQKYIENYSAYQYDHTTSFGKLYSDIRVFLFHGMPKQGFLASLSFIRYLKTILFAFASLIKSKTL
jgi:glycosyltransferase involved in cell wall biosynthesis